ncbi:MAG: radical SAM protein, partial [Phycisphaerales bacterium]|nr:radical SAM protein [Phycisphaerales bacterium]
MTDNTAFPILKQRSIGTSKDPIKNWGQHSTDRSTPPQVGSLYVHIPFCFHKCHYCDFYSIVDRQDRQAAFVDRMIEEIRAQSAATGHPVLDTVFIGGGTPTLLVPQLLETVLSTV